MKDATGQITTAMGCLEKLRLNPYTEPGDKNWLDLSGHRVSTSLMFELGEMNNLTRLNLSGAEIGAGDVLALSGLPELRRLNLRATGLGEALVTNLDLPSLENLYLSTEPSS